MKTKKHPASWPRRASVAAIQGAFAALAASAAQGQTPAPPPPPIDPLWLDLVQGVDTVEAGVRAASGSAAKANEYNGWDGKGPRVIGRIDLRGGGRFDSEDATRWHIDARDIGSTSPSVAMDYGVQGTFRVRLGFDQLRREQSDSYQTPYQGVGTNQLTLPSGWIVPLVPRVSGTAPNARGLSPDVTGSSAIVGGVLTAPTQSQIDTATALQAADLAGFRTVELYTTRTRYSAAWEQPLTPFIDFDAGAAHEHKVGLKPLGAQSRATGGDTSSILPIPIDQDDDSFHASLGYSGDLLRLQASFEGAVFTNHVPSVSWNLWAAPATTAAEATAPSNLFHKISFNGTFRASDSTQVIASVSRARSAQNVAFLGDSTAPLVPETSAHAEVINNSATFKAVHAATSRLNLSAGYRWEERDNRTPVAIFGYYDNNNAASGTSAFAYLFPQLSGLGQNFNINENTPYSRNSGTANLDADLRLGHGQHVKLGLSSQQIERFCKGNWYNCADAPRSRENSLHLDWHGDATENLSARVGFVAARRNVRYDENAFLAGVPMAAQTPGTASGALAGTSVYSTMLALGLTGYGPISGLLPAATPGSALAFYFPNNNVANNLLYGNENRISELVGLRRYNEASRDRNKLGVSANWQATPRLSLQGGVDFTADHYGESVYGLQQLNAFALNLDGSYVLGDDLNLSLFGTFENQRIRTAGNTYTANSTATAVNGATAIDGGCYATIGERNANNKIDPCLDWQSHTHDQTTTLGARWAVNKLFSGKLDITGSAIYTLGRTDIAVTGGSYVNNPYAGIAGNATGTTAAFFIPATPLPTAQARTLDLQLAGAWRLDRDRTLRLVVGFQHLGSQDWIYQGMQDGGLTQVLPTRELSPHYDIHRIALSYSASFR